MRFNFMNFSLFLGVILPFVLGQQFQYATGQNAGSCDSRLPMINDWIEDAKQLSNAFMHAIDNVGTNVVAQRLFFSWFKISFDTNGDVAEADQWSKDSWDQMTESAKEVHKFLVLNEGYAGMQQPPKIFCDDTFAQQMGWDSPVLDDNRNRIVYQGRELKISDVYSHVETAYPKLEPWYAYDEKGYFFAASEPDRLCDPGTLGVAFAGFRGPTQVQFGIVPSELTFNDLILLCPDLFNDQDMAARINDLRYYDPAQQRLSIDDILPRASTLYHEMCHTATGHMKWQPFSLDTETDPRGWHIIDWEYGMSLVNKSFFSHHVY